MYNVLQNLLSDKKGGAIFTLFGPWHFFYIVLTVVVIVVVLLILKNKGELVKQRITRSFVNLAFGLYLFFYSQSRMYLSRKNPHL